MKLKNSNFYETKNSNCEETQKHKLWWNSKTQMVTNLKNSAFVYLMEMPFCPFKNALLYPYIPSTHHNFKPLELGTWNFETMFNIPCVSCVMCHITLVTCHMSYDIVISKILELVTWNFEPMFTIPWVLRVTFHLSRDRCHMSRRKIGKLEGLVSKGLVINRAKSI